MNVSDIEHIMRSHPADKEVFIRVDDHTFVIIDWITIDDSPYLCAIEEGK